MECRETAKHDNDYLAEMLMAEILAAFGLPPGGSTRDMTNRLETFLLKQSQEENRTVVLFIDEAQSIAGKAFAVLRDLLNLETRSKFCCNRYGGVAEN